MLKRCSDIVIALTVLVVLSPLLAVIAVAIHLQDRGPSLFTQIRLGRARRPYRIFKFRTMLDGRISRLGAGLRRTGLDELPQLFNVLRGDMSLIGPRPLTAADVVRLGWDRDLPRWQVRPGITGLAQVYAGVGARLSRFLDQRYVAGLAAGHWAYLDVQIAMVSAAMLVLGKRPVREGLRRRRRAFRAMAYRDWQRLNADPPQRAWSGAGATFRPSWIRPSECRNPRQG